jgi:hypothetical protein
MMNKCDADPGRPAGNDRPVITIEGPIEVHEAGTPEAVGGGFLYAILREHRAHVRVSAEQGRIRVTDLTTHEPIVRGNEDLFGISRPDRHLDPTIFSDPAMIGRFFEALRRAAGSKSVARRITVGSRFGPPYQYALLTRMDLSPTCLEMRIQYHIPRWRYSIAQVMFKIRARLTGK